MRPAPAKRPPCRLFSVLGFRPEGQPAGARELLRSEGCQRSWLVERGSSLAGSRAALESGAVSVYVPTAFAETDAAKLHAFMASHSFAVLVSGRGTDLIASHLPLLLDPAAGPHGTLLGHMARANPHWRQAEGEALAIFSGPHAYVSPSWYDEGGTVPTWNYVAVHAYGTLRIVDDRDGLLDVLRRSVQTYEGSRPEPWPFDESEPHVETLLKAIVGFRIEISQLEGKWKLSQNHPEPRRRRVAQALAAQPDEDSRAIAALMAEGST